MSGYQRQKGARGERAWRDVLRAALADAGLREYADAVQRGGAQSRDGSNAPDVTGTPFLWAEVKSGRSPRLLAALDQATEAQQAAALRDPVGYATAIPVAACRFDGDSQTPPRWVVVLDGQAFAELWAEWLARGER